MSNDIITLRLKHWTFSETKFLYTTVCILQTHPVFQVSMFLNFVMMVIRKVDQLRILLVKISWHFMFFLYQFRLDGLTWSLSKLRITTVRIFRHFTLFKYIYVYIYIFFINLDSIVCRKVYQNYLLQLFIFFLHFMLFKYRFFFHTNLDSMVVCKVCQSYVYNCS